MNQFPDHGINDPDIGQSEQSRLPTAEALLAGTLALMTGHAQGCCQNHRTLMTEKIIANLAMLSSHPQASSGFQAVTARLHLMWVRLLQPLQSLPQTWKSDASAAWSPRRETAHPAAPPQRALWHVSPETVQ